MVVLENNNEPLRQPSTERLLPLLASPQAGTSSVDEHWAARVPESIMASFVRPSALSGLGRHARAPDRLPVAPEVVGETDRQRRGAGRTALPEALVRPHKGGEAPHEPIPSARTAPVPGETSGATPPGRDQASPCAIPPFHAGRLARRTALAQASWLAAAAGAAAHDPPADRHHTASFVPTLNPLGVEAGFGRHAPGRRLTPPSPT
jgi:hypothetical protein